MTIPDYKHDSGKWARTKYEGKKRLVTVSCSVWENIQSRCRSGGAEQKRFPRYVGCTSEFIDFQDFADWHVLQTGYGQGWQIDKDLLCKGNKVYSKTTCILIPQELNSLLCACNASRGEYPLGVFLDGRRGDFTASVSMLEGVHKVGSFPNPVDAFNAYKTFKEAFIKQQANKWKDKIDQRVYNALMKYEVFITD